MKLTLKSHPMSILLLALSIFGFIASIYLGLKFITVRSKLLEEAQQKARQSTEQASQKIDSFFTMLKPISHSIAEELGKPNLTMEQVKIILKKRKPVEITGIGAAFLPYAFDPNVKLFAPYYLERDGKQNMLQLEDVYDYTTPDNTWFSNPLKEGAQFTEPYFGKVSQTILAEYSTPIYRTDAQGNKKAIGIVFTNQSIQHLIYILTTLFLSQRGYWAILNNNNGTFLAHPQEQLVHQQTSIYDLAKKLDNESLADAGKKIAQKESVFLEYNNEITGAPSWLFSSPIKGTNWSMVGVFDKSELEVHPTVLRRHLIMPSLTLLFSIIMFMLFVFSFWAAKHPSRWYIMSAIVSLALTGQTLWVWHAIIHYPKYSKQVIQGMYLVKNKVKLYDYLKKATQFFKIEKTKKQPEKSPKIEKEKVISFIEKSREALIDGYRDAKYIPTGIFVNNIEFEESNQVQISAYVWQRFTKGLHDDLPRGFLLPKATESNITEISRITHGDTETILWQMYAKLNQFFHYENYPFDTKILRIQFWHKFIEKNVILVPDLDSYQLINPRSLPGIAANLYLPGWNVISSSFGYKKANFSSDFGNYAIGPFGIYQSIEKSDIPQFYFNIHVVRRIIDALVSDLLPIAIISFLLFIILLSSVKQQYATIGYCASVFFGTIFAHVRFREKIPQAQIVYLENFYFLMYALLFCVLLSIILYLRFNIPIIHHRKNMITKVLFWPVLFGFISIITLWYLY